MQVFPVLPENWRKIIIVEGINIPCVGIMFIVLESEASHSVTSGAHRLYGYTIYNYYIHQVYLLASEAKPNKIISHFSMTLYILGMLIIAFLCARSSVVACASHMIST